MTLNIGRWLVTFINVARCPATLATFSIRKWMATILVKVILISDTAMTIMANGQLNIQELLRLANKTCYIYYNNYTGLDWGKSIKT